ncbi:MAG: CNNM domain-containing protein, partial [Bacteroidales bacterium]|nr:CNNM domain-containing protein [Bacteroidales bacterium]
MEVFVILGLILLNGYFALAELALISSRKARLESDSRRGDTKAKKAIELSGSPDKFLSIIQIG